MPIPSGAVRSAAYVDCSPQTAVVYLPDFPCDTYVLIRPAALGAEEQLLAARGWRRTRTGWRSAGYSVCASFIRARRGLVADLTSRGPMTKAKLRFILAVTQPETSDPLYAVLYPATFEGSKRC